MSGNYKVVNICVSYLTLNALTNCMVKTCIVESLIYRHIVNYGKAHTEFTLHSNFLKK